MANQIMLIVNPTAAAYADVNGAGNDIAAYACGSTQTNAAGTVTLTDAEQATFSAAHPEALMLLCAAVTGPTNEVRRLAAKILKLGRLPGSSSLVQ